MVSLQSSNASSAYCDKTDNARLNDNKAVAGLQNDAYRPMLDQRTATITNAHDNNHLF